MGKEIADRIIKLLSLADDTGSTSAESENAREKAIYLMAKYELTESDIKKEEVITKSIYIDCLWMPYCNMSLYFVLAEHNGCMAVYRSGNKEYR